MTQHNPFSVAGLYGYPGLSVYCATKHALEGFSQVPAGSILTPPARCCGWNWPSLG